MKKMKKVIGEAFEKFKQKTFGNEKKKVIGEAFEKFEQKTFGNEKNDLNQHKRFKPLHAKPQNSSQRKRECTVHWQIFINVTHTTYDGKCKMHL